jgi:hypothetical protein
LAVHGSLLIVLSGKLRIGDGCQHSAFRQLFFRGVGTIIGPIHLFFDFNKVASTVNILCSNSVQIAENYTYSVPFLDISMAKPTHKVKKANHGKRPANNRGRKAKKKRIKTP